MRSLPRPSREQARDHLSTALELYETTGIQRGYPATPEDFDSVIALYDAYDVANGTAAEPLKGATLATPLRTAIHDGYEFTQSGRKLAAIRVALLRGVELCPVCGISPPRELDHHLPRSAFNPLAIYVRNLVPLCHECNHSKGAADPTDPAQRFIHPYLDALPDISFLRAIVSIEDSALLVRYTIDPGAGLPELMLRRLAHQLNRLKLNERYAREINTYLTSHATAFRMCFESGGTVGVESFLNEQAEVEFAAFHRNHWRPLLLRALAALPAFCNGGFWDVLPVAAYPG
jgi:hypothetical protein